MCNFKALTFAICQRLLIFSYLNHDKIVDVQDKNMQEIQTFQILWKVSQKIIIIVKILLVQKEKCAASKRKRGISAHRKERVTMKIFALTKDSFKLEEVERVNE
jgi:hypothetical protein